MPFVLRRANIAGIYQYVAPRGRKRSYVYKVEDARCYHTEESAQSDKCGNEEVIEVSSAI